ncbi:hypothetical protein LA080_012574 [Diaporthe eres]|nr:hypothetical protein LA080_012574 [Diaporthe eres]
MSKNTSFSLAPDFPSHVCCFDYRAERIAPRSIGLGSETATKFSPLPSPGPEKEWRPQQQASPGRLRLPTSIVTLSQLYSCSFTGNNPNDDHGGPSLAKPFPKRRCTHKRITGEIVGTVCGEPRNVSGLSPTRTVGASRSRAGVKTL